MVLNLSSGRPRHRPRAGRAPGDRASRPVAGPRARVRTTLKASLSLADHVHAALASWLDNFTGAAGAPWLWWAAALVVLLALLLLGMKALGLFPR